jgi:hypothetical protein
MTAPPYFLKAFEGRRSAPRVPLPHGTSRAAERMGEIGVTRSPAAPAPFEADGDVPTAITEVS